MIEISNLYKNYGKRPILKNLNFTVNKGEILGFLGPNGAGKTTTMSILTGYLSYTEGSVKIDGMEVVDSFLSSGTDENDRPLKEVKIAKMTVVE